MRSEQALIYHVFISVNAPSMLRYYKKLTHFWKIVVFMKYTHYIFALLVGISVPSGYEGKKKVSKPQSSNQKKKSALKLHEEYSVQMLNQATCAFLNSWIQKEPPGGAGIIERFEEAKQHNTLYTAALSKIRNIFRSH